jgi:DNA-binding CsgD family transcriptional regulator
MEQEIIKLRREGKTTTEIAKTTGVSYYRQRQIYDAHNVPTPSRYGQTRQTILAMLAEGRLNQNQIAKHLGVSRQLVSEVKLHELAKEGVDKE